MNPGNILEVPALVNPHTHLREDEGVIRDLISFSYQGGADVLGPMPNTSAGLTTASRVTDYVATARRVMSLGEGQHMSFIPFGMLTEQFDPQHLATFRDAGIRNMKVYPLNRTTKSENGVRDYHNIFDVVKFGGLNGMIFHFHPEHPWMAFENRDAEFAFLSIADMFIRLTRATIVWEHGTDARCIPFWKEMAQTGRFFLTLTAHHLLTSESACFGDVRTVCKPPIKTERDRSDLVELIRENHPWVMAGADDAFHPSGDKHVHEGSCACGAFTTPYMLQLYAHALDKMLMNDGQGEHIFVNFTSSNARRLHGLPRHSRTVRLERRPFNIEPVLSVGPYTAEPFWANRQINWSPFV